jgi:tRNA(fMet)-specific endonuclease VapC
MTRYLLDTNIISAIIEEPEGRAAERLIRVGVDRVCTSVIVAAELRYGAAKKGSARLADDVGRVLDSLPVLPFAPPADLAYGALRAEQEKRGQPIGANDLLVAAHALALDCTLVTDNVREFARVKALTCENWLR